MSSKLICYLLVEIWAICEKFNKQDLCCPEKIRIYLFGFKKNIYNLVLSRFNRYFLLQDIKNNFLH